MPHTVLIDPREAALSLDDPNWLFVDCRWILANPPQGRRDYETSHIAGAIYANLDEDLSGEIVKGKTGRHPLPEKFALTNTFSRFGIDASTQVVAYDDGVGQSAAGRLWWLLKWAGHDAAAVLDGGLKAWSALGLPTRGGVETHAPRAFVAHFRDEMIATADDLMQDSGLVVLDARGADRYRGENETIDPVAGHVPGALSAPFAENITPHGHMQPAEFLRQRFLNLVGDAEPARVVFYCGSGVSAAQDVLAFELAGLGTPRLYAGSWSDWINDPARPRATGSEPGGR